MLCISCSTHIWDCEIDDLRIYPKDVRFLLCDRELAGQVTQKKKKKQLSFCILREVYMRTVLLYENCVFSITTVRDKQIHLHSDTANRCLRPLADYNTTTTNIWTNLFIGNRRFPTRYAVCLQQLFISKKRKHSLTIHVAYTHS